MIGVGLDLMCSISFSPSSLSSPEIYMYSETCVIEPLLRLTLNSWLMW